MNRYNKAGRPTSKPVAEAIEALRDALFREYGCDYVFAVMGNGHVLGASYKENGIIHAVIEEV